MAGICDPQIEIVRKQKMARLRLVNFTTGSLL